MLPIHTRVLDVVDEGRLSLRGGSTSICSIAEGDGKCRVWMANTGWSRQQRVLEDTVVSGDELELE